MFEEMRTYLPGDDIRNIDWKATARTGEAYVRVYTEERERPVLLVVDQSSSMFFGSKDRFKSHAAAELAASIAWRVLDQGDAIGAVVFNDEHQVEIKPRRSKQTVAQIIDALVDFNTRLTASTSTNEENPFVRALKRVVRLAAHDFLVIVISDFERTGRDSTRPYFTRIRRHNDAIAVGVFDPLEMKFPDAGKLVVSDGAVQMEVDTASSKVQADFAQQVEDRRDGLRQTALKFDVPWIEISTEEDPMMQFRRALGGTGGR